MTGILGAGTNAKQLSAAGSLQFQTSQAGGVIPLVYGATRVACNLLDYQGFTATPTGGKGGGKSGGKGGVDGKGNGQYKYSASIILGICEGTATTGGVGFGLCWYDKNIAPLAGLPGISHIATGGEGDQSPDPYWVANYENDAIGYSGTAWFSADNYQLGMAPTLPNFSVEVLSLATAVNQSDGNPAAIVVDFLTNDRYGAGFPAANLDAAGSIADWGNYCDAAGIFLAPQLDQQTAAMNALKNIADLTVSAVVWSGNLLKVVPYGDAPIAATYWIVELNGDSTVASGDQFQLTFASAGLGSITVTYGAQPANTNTDTVDPSGPMGNLAKQVNSNGKLTGYGISAGVGVAATVVRLAGSDQSVTVTPSMGTSFNPNPGNETFTVIGPIVKTWTPDTTVQYSLDDDDFIVQESTVGTYLGVTPGSPALRLGAGPVTGGFNADPVRVKRTSPADVMNYVQLECLDRAYSYNTQIVEVFDQGMVDLYGVRKDTSLKARAIVDPALVGPTVAGLIKQRNVAYLNTYEFSLGWQYCLLEPMDLVEIADPYLGLAKVVRITAIAEDEEGVLNITAEDFFGLASGAVGSLPAQAAPKQTAAPTASIPFFNSPAPAAAAPFIFEPTAQLLQALGLASIVGSSSTGAQYAGSPRIVVGLAGAGAIWGGTGIWVSLDDESYSQQGTFIGRSTMGVSTDIMSAFSGATVDIDLSQSSGLLNSNSPLAAANGVSLCAISDQDGANLEFFTFTTATLVSANVYTVTSAGRGLYGTAAADHAPNSRFLYLGNGQYYEAILPPQYAGHNLWFKFPAFNIVGAGEESLAATLAYEYTPQGMQLNPSLVTARSAMAAESAATTRADRMAPVEAR